MKIRLLTAIAFTAMAIFSCNEDTDNIGSSLTQNTDDLKISTGIYQATTRSILADSVYARNFDCYFGMVKDPETDTYVKTEYMAQFNMLENLDMPGEDKILSRVGDEIVADSCEIWFYFDKANCYGDSLTPMKVRVMELDKAMDSEATYYSNYDPEKEGYIREGGLQKDLVFTLANLTYPDSLRYSGKYADIGRVTINDPYTDKNGKTYSNYGTYLLQNYYAHPEYFKNSYTFVQNMCPGFYFKHTDGLGVMAKMARIELRTFFRCTTTDDSLKVLTLASTSEVLQTVKVTNDREGLERLVSDDNCTYLKAPAGIFTEVTLPVEEIMEDNFLDYLLSVSISFERLNSLTPNDKYNFAAPSTILLVPKDSLYSFFEKEKTYDYKSYYVASLSKNNYTFTNLGDLISSMYLDLISGTLDDPDWVKKHPDWNKVVLVPITQPKTITVTTNSGSTTTSTTPISNQIGLSSTQLVGGKNAPIEIKVIFAKFL
jgi:hypothetical protein